MSVIKGLGYLGAAALGVLVVRLGLDMAVEDLSHAHRAEQIADARSEAPAPTLAPVMTPSPLPSPQTPIEAPIWEDSGFGTPDPEFGRGSPAVGEPAWGAAERQRQAAAAEASAEIVPPS